MKNTKGLFVAQSGVIAALYVALTWVSSLAGLSFGSIQFRLSEVLTILPVFTPAAIPGLTIGCLIANLGSPYGILDIALGSFATLVAAILARAFRNITLFNLPVLSALMPVIANSIAVSIVLSVFLADPGKSVIALFCITALQVGLGELVTGTFSGLVLYKSLKASRFENILGDKGNKQI